MDILGFFGAFLMGLSLGFIGGGGSILTVPIFVYLFHIDAVLATSYSLFTVGITSLAGSVNHVKMGNIHWRTAVLFGMPAIMSVFLTRVYILPSLPNQLFNISDFEVNKSLALLILFAVLMLLAAFSMIKPEKESDTELTQNIHYNFPLIIAEGLLVGCITGLVGAGGGFLIVPALVFITKLPMKKAIGTSLIIIAFKSIIGFVGDMKSDLLINWSFLISFTFVAVIGIIIGSLGSKYISERKLKPVFGWFILVMGVFIIVKELIIR